jgi:hypothetical protein
MEVFDDVGVLVDSRASTGLKIRPSFVSCGLEVQESRLIGELLRSVRGHVFNVSIIGTLKTYHHKSADRPRWGAAGEFAADGFLGGSMVSKYAALLTVAASLVVVSWRVETLKAHRDGEVALYAESTTITITKPGFMVVEVENLTDVRHDIDDPQFVDVGHDDMRYARPKEGVWAVFVDFWIPSKNRMDYILHGHTKKCELRPNSCIFIRFGVPRYMLAAGKCRMQARLVKGDVLIARSRRIVVDCVDDRPPLTDE